VSEPESVVAARLHRELAAATAVVQGLAADHQWIVESSQGSNADDEHDIEGASIAFERAQVDGYRLRAQARVQAVEAALARLEDGSYGRCAGCGQPIAAERLAALPAAVTCIVHAR